MRQPNILIITTDQQRSDALGANGNREIITPNLDRLAAEGVNFPAAFCQHPLCMPSRVSFLTGRYPSALGILEMGIPVPAETLTLPRMLKSRGYVTANIGKLHFQTHANRDYKTTYPDYGFDHLELSDEPGCYEDDYRAWVRRKAPDQIDHVSLGLSGVARDWQRLMRVKDGIHHDPERGTSNTGVFPGRSDVTYSAWVADQTMSFLDRRPRGDQGDKGGHGDPFMCISAFYAPHNPWIVPKEFLDMYDPSKLTLAKYPPEIEAKRGEAFSDETLRRTKHAYYAYITELDHHVGRILGKLRERGLEEDTIVVFWSDHGEYLGEYLGDHLGWGKWHPGYDCISRVPLIIRAPGVGRRGEQHRGLAESVDVVPTLLELAGMQVPTIVQGRSLVPVLRDPAGAGRDSVMMEGKGIRNIRTSRWRYVMHCDDRDELLFDLEKDPREYHNVAGEAGNTGVIAEMRREMLRRMMQAETSQARVWPY